MTILKKLQELSLELPEVSKPGGNYVSVNVRKDTVYVAIQFPIKNDNYLYQGRLGGEISSQQGYEAIRLCALNVLAQVEYTIGFDNILGLNHIDAYYQSVKNWDDAPDVVNGASDLFVDVLGDKGVHTRAILGVESLAKNFCVGLTTSFTLK